MQRVNFLNSPVDGGAVISTDGAPASFVFVGAVTSDGITSAGGILDRDSKTPGGRGAATSAANFTKLEPSDEWVQLVKKVCVLAALLRIAVSFSVYLSLFPENLTLPAKTPPGAEILLHCRVPISLLFWNGMKEVALQ